MLRTFKLLSTAAKSWLAENAFKHSAAVSFYTLFSLPPAAIIATAVAGFLFGRKAAAGEFAGPLTQFLGKGSADMIQKTLASFQTQQTHRSATGAGVALFLVGAVTVFGQLQYSLNEIWGVQGSARKDGLWVLILRRAASFGMVVTVGLLLLLSLLLATAVSILAHMSRIHFSAPPALIFGVDILIVLVAATFLFALILKVLPDVSLAWRDVWWGAFVAAALFSVGRGLIALYLAHSSLTSSYGAAGSLVAVLLWVYYSCAILFFGAHCCKADQILRKGFVKPASHGKARKPRQEVKT